jgi:hypothetical protein
VKPAPRTAGQQDVAAGGVRGPLLGDVASSPSAATSAACTGRGHEQADVLARLDDRGDAPRSPAAKPAR